MQSHHNSVGVDNDESLVTPKTCDKTETQATKKLVFLWRKKDPSVLEEAFTIQMLQPVFP